MAGEMFKMMASALAAVPYRGGEGSALPDLISGQVQIMLARCLHRLAISGAAICHAGGDQHYASGSAAERPTVGEFLTGLKGERLVWDG